MSKVKFTRLESFIFCIVFVTTLYQLYFNKIMCINQIGEEGLLLSTFSQYHTGFYKAGVAADEKKVIRNVFKDGDVYFNFGDLVYLDKDYFIYFRDRVGDTYRLG